MPAGHVERTAYPRRRSRLDGGDVEPDDVRLLDIGALLGGRNRRHDVEEDRRSLVGRHVQPLAVDQRVVERLLAEGIGSGGGFAYLVGLLLAVDAVERIGHGGGITVIGGTPRESDLRREVIGVDEDVGMFVQHGRNDRIGRQGAGLVDLLARQQRQRRRRAGYVSEKFHRLQCLELNTNNRGSAPDCR